LENLPFIQKSCREKGAKVPGLLRRPMYKGFQLILRENVSFSTGLIFETVLLDVRNKMKNVLDELYGFGLSKRIAEKTARQRTGRSPGPTGGRPINNLSLVFETILHN
jgi:hypothetical protein